MNEIYINPMCEVCDLNNRKLLLRFFFKFCSYLLTKSITYLLQVKILVAKLLFKK